MMKGVLDFLTSDDEIAVELRKIYVFKIMPMINPDGVVVGNYRRSLTGRDMNRNYRTILQESFPSIYSIKRLLKRLNTPPREILMYTDFHGHNRKNNIFIYGCTPTEQNRKENKPMPKQSKQERFSEKVFPYLLQQKCPELFSFNDCKFNIQKSKEGTGRIVAWRSGIINAYTLEASFCGTQKTARKDTHLSISDLETMGKKFCEALYEFSKEEVFEETLQMMQEMTRKRVVEKVIYSVREKSDEIGDELYDKLMDTVDIEQVDNSDIESDTEGSDSSDDDGLPTNLNGSDTKMGSKPKTRSKSRKSAGSKIDFSKKTQKTSKPRSIAFEKVSSVLQDLKKSEPPESDPQRTSFIKSKRRIVQGITSKINRPRQELKISKIERVSTIDGTNVITEISPERPVKTNFEWPKDKPDAEPSRNHFRSPAIVKAEELIPEFRKYPNISQQHTLNVLYQYPRTLGSVRNSVHSLIQNQLDMMKSDIERTRSSTIRENKHSQRDFTKRDKSANLTKVGSYSQRFENLAGNPGLPETKFFGKNENGNRMVNNSMERKVYYSASPTLYNPNFPENGDGLVNLNNMLPGKHKFRYSMPLEYNDKGQNQQSLKNDQNNYNYINYGDKSHNDRKHDDTDFNDTNLMSYSNNKNIENQDSFQKPAGSYKYNEINFKDINYNDINEDVSRINSSRKYNDINYKKRQKSSPKVVKKIENQNIELTAKTIGTGLQGL